MDEVTFETTDSQSVRPPLIHQATDEHGYISAQQIPRAPINNPDSVKISEDQESSVYVKGGVSNQTFKTDEHGYVIMQDNIGESPKPKLPDRRSKITIFFDTPDGENCTMETEVKTYVLGTGFPVTCTQTDVVNFISAINLKDESFEVDFDAWTGEACIEFHSIGDADRFLTRYQDIKPCHFQSYLVKFRKTRRQEKDTHSALLCGFSDTTSDGDICDFLEKKCHLKPKRITRGTRKGTAVVTFDHQLVVEQLSDVCQRRACRGYFMTANSVNESKSIRVSGYNTSTSPATIQSYLETRVTNVISNMEEATNENSMIVNFTSKPDTDVLCHEKHVLDDAELCVCVYYKCLFDCPRRIKQIPEPFIFDELDAHIAKFIIEKEYYKKRIETRLRNCNARAVWLETTLERQSATKLQIHCTVLENAAHFHESIDNWKSLAIDTLQNELKPFSVSKDICFAEEIRAHVVGYIKCLTSDDALISFHSQDGYLVVAGTTNTVDMIAEKIGKEIDAFESECAGFITKRIRIFAGHRIIIGATTLKARIQSLNSPDVEMVFCKGKNVAVLKGNKSEVDGCFKRIATFLRGMKTGRMQINQLKQKLLERTEILANTTIDDAMNKNDTVCVISLDDCGELCMSSFGTITTLQELSTKLNTLVQEKTYKMSTYLMKSTESASKLKEMIEFRFHEYCVIDIRSDVVHIVGVIFIMHAIEDEVIDFLDQKCFVSKVFPIEYGRFWYLQNYKRIDFESSLREHPNVAYEVVNENLNTGIALAGCKESVKRAIGCFQSLVDSIALNVVTLDWVGFPVYAKTASGIDDLTSLQLRQGHTCLITATKKIETASQIGHSYRLSGDGHTKAEVKANYTVGTATISLYLGDVLSMSGDILVNPCTEEFLLDRELGARILRKGGYQLRNILHDEIATRKPFIGQILETPGEMLDFKTVIHVATPVLKDVQRLNESELLLASIIHDCVEYILWSTAVKVVMTPIGIGQFKFSAEKVASLMCSTLKTCLQNRPKSSNITDVIICVETNEMFEDFVTALSEENDNFKLIKGISKTKRKPIDIEIGTTADHTTDVIVNSTNSRMTLDIGEFSRHLMVSAGKRIQEECTAKYPKGIKIGQVAVTDAGTLTNKAVFHGSLPHYDGGNGYAQAALSVFVWKCLSLVNEKQFMSVAFPMLGTGHLGMPPDMVARTMLDVVQLYQARFPDTSLDRVAFLLLAEDKENKKALAKAQNDTLTGDIDRPPLIIPNAFSKLIDICTEEHTFSAVAGGIALSVFQGDLVTQTTAAIVNSVDDISNLCTGIISRVICEAAGPNIQKECKSKQNVEHYKEYGMVVTSSGRLLCQNIIHVKARNSLKGWTDTVGAVLARAERLKLSSISFPALGTGCKGFNPEDIAKTIHNAVRQYGESESYLGVLKVVNIIPYKKGMTEKMVAAITKLSSSRPGSMLSIMKPTFLRRNHESNLVTFHIYGETLRIVESAQKRLEKQCIAWQNKIRSSV